MDDLKDNVGADQKILKTGKEALGSSICLSNIAGLHWWSAVRLGPVGAHPRPPKLYGRLIVPERA